MGVGKLRPVGWIRPSSSHCGAGSGACPAPAGAQGQELHNPVPRRRAMLLCSSKQQMGSILTSQVELKKLENEEAEKKRQHEKEEKQRQREEEEKKRQHQVEEKQREREEEEKKREHEDRERERQHKERMHQRELEDKAKEREARRQMQEREYEEQEKKRKHKEIIMQLQNRNLELMFPSMSWTKRLNNIEPRPDSSRTPTGNTSEDDDS
ncbi:capping protein inhibiting regulator of actin dynamics-like isoform X2 [Gopherus flavomarginatus]|uniref:capping protein inhibiting regulator of actin dynamics-like isoform X2 n=1 Tax=Gopherus flavomarginatus TaxID=286002 RepID=UPI0021CBB644|nr:capping protein inhibiting regulator of actin dynamics-like isoform X2 [Gopherus flavomarginatus]XP_050824873.1 capping protein inhibiting regulator of actin dynamics-like isoform X2 [Gopherus flavomarginatus]